MPPLARAYKDYNTGKIISWYWHSYILRPWRYNNILYITWNNNDNCQVIELLDGIHTIKFKWDFKECNKFLLEN